MLGVFKFSFKFSYYSYKVNLEVFNMSLARTYGLCNEEGGLLDIKSLAVSNEFCLHMSKGCYAMGKNLMPFSLCSTDKQEEYGVTDLSIFSGLVNTEITLIDEIANYRRGEYAKEGIFLGNTPDINRTLFFDYLLTVSVCYVEVPKYITQNGVPTKAYDKFLATRNPTLMGTWMGEPTFTMQAKYSSRIGITPADLMNGTLRLVKLMSSPKGTSIVCPRKTFNAKDISCTPLFMSYAFIKGTESVMRDSIIEFTYLKDNGTFRTLNTTLSSDILYDYYGDTAYVGSMLENVDIPNMSASEDGLVHISKGQGRGYVRVPEVGLSKYDATGVRALNVSRVLACKKVDSVDRSFINVDISSVVYNFNECLDHLASTSPEMVLPMAKALGVFASDDEAPTELASLLSAVKTYVSNQDTLFSTKYREQLHLFMIHNSVWFSRYTGKPVMRAEDSSGFGVATMEF